MCIVCIACISPHRQSEWTFFQVIEIKLWISGCYSVCSHKVQPACSVLFEEIFDAIGHLLLHIWNSALLFFQVWLHWHGQQFNTTKIHNADSFFRSKLTFLLSVKIKTCFVFTFCVRAAVRRYGTFSLQKRWTFLCRLTGRKRAGCTNETVAGRVLCIAGDWDNVALLFWASCMLRLTSAVLSSICLCCQFFSAKNFSLKLRRGAASRLVSDCVRATLFFCGAKSSRGLECVGTPLVEGCAQTAR